MTMGFALYGASLPPLRSGGPGFSDGPAVRPGPARAQCSADQSGSVGHREHDGHEEERDVPGPGHFGMRNGLTMSRANTTPPALRVTRKATPPMGPSSSIRATKPMMARSVGKPV